MLRPYCARTMASWVCVRARLKDRWVEEGVVVVVVVIDDDDDSCWGSSLWVVVVVVRTWARRSSRWTLFAVSSSGEEE